MDARALKFAEEATKRANSLAALGARDDVTGAPLTEQERAEAEAVRKTAVSQVGNAIRIVRAQLAEIEAKVSEVVVVVVGVFLIRRCPRQIR